MGFDLITYALCKGDSGGGSPGSTYELLNNVTMTEAVSEIELTQSDDGLAYNLDHIAVHVTGWGEVDKNYGAIEVYINGGFVGKLENAINSERVACVYCDNYHGKMRSRLSWANNNNTTTATHYFATPSVFETDFVPIKSIKLKFPENTITCRFKVWGC